MLNEIGRIIFVFEGLFITETYDAYTFILESLLQISTYRSKLRRKKILIQLEFQRSYFDDHFHLK